MTTRRLRERAAVLASCLLVISAARSQAQSNLSTQGFGYSTGQFSSRSAGTAGALAEMDPLSPVNPASIALIGGRLLFFQLEPEFRSVTTPNGTERTTTARYPVVFGAIPVAGSLIMSLSASTLLDRSATTSFSTTQIVNGTDSVPMNTLYRVAGAMDDIRLAAGWAPSNWLRLGVGVHGITGHNLVNLTQSFTDSAQFAAFSQSRILGFGGVAVSAGAQLVSRSVIAAFSVRQGGALHLYSQDTVLTSARVPNRFGASIAYTGIANSAISIRTAHDSWSSLGGLGTTAVHPVDAWDSSLGADIAGPALGNRPLFLRGGVRTRTLPFQAAGASVGETSESGGLGTTFANSRVLADLALVHAARTASISASENAWTVSIGISIRP